MDDTFQVHRAARAAAPPDALLGVIGVGVALVSLLFGADLLTAAAHAGLVLLPLAWVMWSTHRLWARRALRQTRAQAGAAASIEWSELEAPGAETAARGGGSYAA